MIYVLLPCYNEAQNLQPLVREIDRTLDTYQIVAVDDGSTDGTQAVLTTLQDQFQLIVQQHPANRGLQQALLTGIEYILEKAAADDILVTMDADGTHEPTYIPALATRVQEGASLAVGSRYVHGGEQVNVTLMRRILSRGINELLRLTARIPIADQTSGFRAFNVAALATAQTAFQPDFIEASGFGVSAELLIKTCFAVNCQRAAEVPIILDYGRKQGTSGLALTDTIVDYLRLLVRIPRWQRMVQDSPSRETADSQTTPQR